MARWLVLLSVVLLLPALMPPAYGQNRLATVIDHAQNNLLETRIAGEYWSFPAYLGPHYVAQYYLFLRWSGRKSANLDPDRLHKQLISSQLPDGSWYAVRDANDLSGEISPTVLNYWALKALGEPTSGDVMSRARSWILAHGGLEKTGMLTKVQLAMFGNFPWSGIPSIPLITFMNLPVVNPKNFAQWIVPHLKPVAALRKMQPVRDVGKDCQLPELMKAEPIKVQPGQTFFGEHSLIAGLVSERQPRGSWGGYTPATMLSLCCLDEYVHHAATTADISAAMDEGLKFLDRCYFPEGPSAYMGVTMDGRYWDTMLALLALRESGRATSDLDAPSRFLRQSQTPTIPGGIAFGEDFWYAPDTDDAAMAIQAVHGIAGLETFNIARSVDWLVSMQNCDGGYGAFDRNNNGNVVLSFLARKFADGADLFDDSAPDTTGHIIEALALRGQNISNSKTITRAIKYLKSTQDRATGGWFGRWGINYIYGTAAVLGGLARAGVDMQSPWVYRATKWLLGRQNPDGGFGESPRSYLQPQLAGVGLSTPTQTAWALIGLMAGGEGRSGVAKKAADYLLAEFERDGRWIDRSTVGTGHPGIVYMDYPSYPYTFPLIALARYRKGAGTNWGSIP